MPAVTHANPPKIVLPEWEECDDSLLTAPSAAGSGAEDTVFELSDGSGWGWNVHGRAGRFAEGFPREEAIRRANEYRFDVAATLAVQLADRVPSINAVWVDGPPSADGFHLVERIDGHRRRVDAALVCAGVVMQSVSGTPFPAGEVRRHLGPLAEPPKTAPA